MSTPKIMTVLGTRPDLIRMSKLLNLLDECNELEHVFVHTGQHFSYNLDEIFYKEMKIRKPDFNLKVGQLKQTLAEQLSRLFIQIELVIDKVNPDYLLFLGDTNTVLASILAARKNIKIIHIEAGMRSYDWSMPEEKNRIIIDKLSDILYVYLDNYKAQALKDGIDPTKISVVGNIIVDILKEWSPKISTSLLLNKLEPGNFIYSTIHREENIESFQRLSDIIESLKTISKDKNLPVVLPLMPRTLKQLNKFKINYSDLNTIEPTGFAESLAMQKYARLVLTDSGTIQEESCILGTPCGVLRKSTERPETFECKSGKLLNPSFRSIMDGIEELFKLKLGWQQPFGDGNSSERILNDLINRLAK